MCRQRLELRYEGQVAQKPDTVDWARPQISSMQKGTIYLPRISRHSRRLVPSVMYTIFTPASFFLGSYSGTVNTAFPPALYMLDI